MKNRRFILFLFSTVAAGTSLVLSGCGAPAPAPTSTSVPPTKAVSSTPDNRPWGVEFEFVPPVSEEFPWAETGTWETHYFVDEFTLVGDELVMKASSGGNEIHNLVGNVPLADFLSEFDLCLSGINYTALNANGGTVYYRVLTSVKKGSDC